jgi:hypothetical protein
MTLSSARVVAALAILGLLLGSACGEDGQQSDPSRRAGTPRNTAAFPNLYEQLKVNCFLAAVARSTDKRELSQLLGAQDTALGTIAERLFSTEGFDTGLTDEESKQVRQGCVAGLRLAGVNDQRPSDPDPDLVIEMLRETCKNEMVATGRSNPREYLRFAAENLDARSAEPEDVAAAYVEAFLVVRPRSPVSRLPSAALVDACESGFEDGLQALAQ